MGDFRYMMTNHNKGFPPKNGMGANPTENQIGSYLNGKKLPHNVLENFRGFSFCPLYSEKQLRKIHRIKKEKTNNVNRRSNEATVKRAIKNKLRTIDTESVNQ